MTKSEIFKAAHKLAKTFQGDYSACLALALKQVYKEMKNTPKSYELAIPYSDSKARSVAKNWGAKWNALTKTWTINVKPKEQELFDYSILASYVITNTNTNTTAKIQRKAQYSSMSYSEQVLAGIYREG